ncbi:Fis family transcriptional regulator [Xanthomonas arboricola pv. populi]|uniref:Fis family transcriptional regulator n=1 Tax=Xanthomonas arboricola pv. populi TaxID=487823 RepID=A0A2S6Z7M4_9XANT|nr:helix-turn-helix domain-containing protein [Xanthomonas arboricola]PPT77469.1 Fis family transcriptional regulator [Xanthomonas arboricola pv. populi]
MSEMAFEGEQWRLERARARFAEGEALPETLLPTPLARSWERSRRAGLRPWQAPNYEALQPLGNPRAHPDDRRLAQAVGPEIEPLWAAFGGRDWTVFCVNPHGMIVRLRQHPESDRRLLRPLREGRRILEADVGTTAPSCTLAEDRPALVRGHQHYLSTFAPMFCLSVPLHGLDRELVGALDITGIGARETSLLLGHFRQAALAAENRLYAGLRDCHLLRVQYDTRWTATPLHGLLAVRADGSVRAANGLARRLFALPRTGALSALGLEQLFAAAVPAQRRRLLQRGAPWRLAMADGSAVCVEYLRPPLASVPRRAAASPVAAAGPALREQTLRTVAEALRLQGGNVAAAARQLGISRTTLYKKLRAPPSP